MKTLFTTACFLVLSTLVFAQGVDITYVDNRFVDAKGIPVTGEFNFVTPSTSENANVRLSNGQLTGVAIYYFADGKVKEIANYKNGLKHGEWYQFNQNGNLIMQANYNENKKQGTWKVWDDSGKIRMKMKYHNGNKKGIWKEWNANGSLTNKRKF
jgi:antitoxin component YwqK of YwqJK toxin-antitoxin module